MHPIIFKIGPITIFSYGLMVALAFLAGIAVSIQYAKKEKINKDIIFDLAIYVLVASIIGARLLYVAGQWDVYQDNLIEIVMLNKGGLVVIGGILGAILATFFYAKNKKIPFLKLFDICTPGTMLGLAIGRIGCLLNGCCFGVPADTFLSLSFPAGSLANAYYGTTNLHPAQIYDAVLLFVSFLILMLLYNKKKYAGQIFFAGLLLYSIVRFLVESFRFSPMHWLGLTPSQWMVVFFAIISSAFLFWHAKRI
jgi:phosphatidylglycerol:prolipoprotein diacylglycerol transferase